MINALLAGKYFFNPYALPYYLTGILALTEGIFVLIQNPESLVNLSYMASTVTGFFWLAGVGAIYSCHSEAVALWFSKYLSFFGIIFIIPSIYCFSVAWQSPFLNKKQRNEHFRWVFLNFVVGALFYRLCTSTDFLIDGMWKYPWGFYPKAGKFYAFLVAWFFLLMILSTRNFLFVVKKDQPVIKKKQAKAIITAYSIAFIGSVEFLPNFGVAKYLLAFLPVFICITIIGYSIVKYRLLDIETVVHKTIAWIFSTCGLTLSFVAIYLATRPWYDTLSSAWLFLYTSSFTLLCLVLLQKLQPKINHFFQRGQFNRDLLLQNFVNELVYLKGLDELIAKISDIIMDNLYSEKVSFLLYDGKKSKLVPFSSPDGEIDLSLDLNDPFLTWITAFDNIVYRDFVEIDPEYKPALAKVSGYMKKTNTMVCLPLILNARPIGLINIGRKKNLKSFDRLDHHFLKHLRSQATIAISNSLLYQTIEEEVKIRTKELVDTQKQLVQAEKLATVGTLAGGVAHEINNPLTAIMTNVQMLLTSDMKFDEDTKESLELMEEAAKRCRSIVQKLMTYAKKPMGPEEIKKVNLVEVINGVKAFLGYQLQQENIRLVISATADEFWVKGNHNELEQVVTNLILNAKDAIKKVKKSDNIYIRLYEVRDVALIDIRDEGSGIPKEVLPKIFDPFFTTKEIGKGVGLGLSICQSIMEKHGGSISVQSEPNKGATFTMKLPRIS